MLLETMTVAILGVKQMASSLPSWSLSPNEQ